jgi:hypothetical protein
MLTVNSVQEAIRINNDWDFCSNDSIWEEVNRWEGSWDTSLSTLYQKLIIRKQ